MMAFNNLHFIFICNNDGQIDKSASRTISFRKGPLTSASDTYYASKKSRYILSFYFHFYYKQVIKRLVVLSVVEMTDK